MSATGRIRVALAGRLGTFALDVAFDVPARGITVLFGPSGCGKTTVLRCIAGLQRIPSGLVDIEGDVWQDSTSHRPAHRRPIGYVFQEASLFPHLSVRRNLTFGAPRDRAASSLPSVTFDEIVDLLRIAPLLDRATSNLSGGERQRVAIGRALLSQPKLLLMDEPLSALDKGMKEEVLPFLERLHNALDIPVIYVSHDMEEIESLADQIVLLKSGRVIACGPIADIQSDPSLPLAMSRQAAVSLEGHVGDYDPAYGLLTIEIAGGFFAVPSPSAATKGAPRRLRIAANDVSLSTSTHQTSSILNVLPCRIISATDASEYEIVAVIALGDDGDGARLLSRLTRKSWDALQLREGMRVTAQVKSVALAAR